MDFAGLHRARVFLEPLLAVEGRPPAARQLPPLAADGVESSRGHFEFHAFRSAINEGGGLLGKSAGAAYEGGRKSSGKCDQREKACRVHAAKPAPALHRKQA